jgi:chemotaxis protein CheX
MKVEYVNPFLNAMVHVLATMAQLEVTPGKPFIKKSLAARGEISGMIGLAGKQLKGSLAINFTKEAILQIAGKMLGEKLTEVNDTVRDAVGELTNIVTGGAKRALSEKGYKFEMALPTIITGLNHTITHVTKAPTVVVPFRLDGDKEFFVEVSFEEA